MPAPKKPLAYCSKLKLSPCAQDAVFADVLELVKDNLTPDRGEAFVSAIVALGHIAFHLPDKFPVHIKNIVSRCQR